MLTKYFTDGTTHQLGWPVSFQTTILCVTQDVLRRALWHIFVGHAQRYADYGSESTLLSATYFILTLKEIPMKLFSANQ